MRLGSGCPVYPRRRRQERGNGEEVVESRRGLVALLTLLTTTAVFFVSAAGARDCSHDGSQAMLGNDVATVGWAPSSRCTPPSEVRGCFVWWFADLELSCRRGLTGRVILKNSCQSSIAFITDPWEVRLRVFPEQRFVFEWLSRAPYSRLYVVRREVGREGMYLGDGGLTVQGLPEYVVVGAGQELEIPFQVDPGALRGLTEGEYLVFAEAYLVPTATRGHDRSAEKIVIPPEGGVEHHNRKNAGAERVFVRTHAVWSDSLEASVTAHSCSTRARFAPISEKE